MKKSTIAISFLLAILSTGSAQATVQNNTWYMGTRIGWSRFDLLPKGVDPALIVDNATEKKLSAPIVGVFVGYKFNPYFSVEVSDHTTGFSPYLAFKNTKKPVQFNDINISTKLFYPANDYLNFYTRLGAATFWNDLSDQENTKKMFTKESIIIPSVSFGLEYHIDDHLFTSLDYSWKNSIKNILDSEIKPNTGDFIFSFGWKFGSTPIKNVLLNIPKIIHRSNVKFHDSINFPFNSALVQSSALEKLHILSSKIKKLKPKNVIIKILGYSDRMGNDSYNQTLSEERAYNIKNYFSSHGISRNNLTIYGMGATNPITNHACNHVKNRALLISCLAPDRRVEIDILANL